MMISISSHPDSQEEDELGGGVEHRGHEQAVILVEQHLATLGVGLAGARGCRGPVQGAQRQRGHHQQGNT